MSIGWEWGYKEPSGGGHTRVVGNWIHHIGRFELSDMGGVYVLGHAEGTVIQGNVVAYVAPYHGCAHASVEPNTNPITTTCLYPTQVASSGDSPVTHLLAACVHKPPVCVETARSILASVITDGWGIYLDEGACGVHVSGNVVFRTWSAGLHQHFGHNNTIAGNVFACAGQSDGDIALSIGEEHQSFEFVRNVVLRCPTDWMRSSASRAASAKDTATWGDEAAQQAQQQVQQAQTSSLVSAQVSAGGVVAMPEVNSRTAAGDEAQAGTRADEGPLIGSLGAPYPLSPSWLFWWKGEGSTPQLLLDENVYYSLVPEEGGAAEEKRPAERGAAEEGARADVDTPSQQPPASPLPAPPARSAPPSLHFLKRGRTLKGWQRLGQDTRSLWADPGFRNAADCDFTLTEGSVAASLGVPPTSFPAIARGRPAGGDGGGCGLPVWPGNPAAPPEPLELPPLPAGELPTPKALSRVVPNGARMLRRHKKQQRMAEERQREAKEAQEQMLGALRYEAFGTPDARARMSHGPACWAESKMGKRGKYLPECTQDGCHDHGTLAEAAAICGVLGDSCGGVTADETRSSFQTRVGPRVRSGPPEETSWVKRDCQL